MSDEQTIPEGVHRAAAMMFPAGVEDGREHDFRLVIEAAYLAGRLDEQKEQREQAERKSRDAVRVHIEPGPDRFAVGYSHGVREGYELGRRRR